MSTGRRRLASAFLFALTSATTLAITTDALAQAATPETLAAGDAGADTHLFRAPVDSKGFLSVNGADIVGHLDFSLGLFLDYAYGIMPVAEDRHGEGKFLLDHSFQGTLQFDLGLANFLVLGLSAPVVLAGHDQLTDIGPTGALYDVPSAFAQGLGYIALHAKFRIIRPEDRPSVGLAAILQGGIGVAGTHDLISESGGFIWPQVVFEGRAAPEGIFRVGLNGGFRANFGGTNAIYGLDLDDVPVLEKGIFEYGQLVTAGLGTSVHVVQPLELVAETYASFLVTGENDADQKISAEAIGGMKLYIDERSFLMLGGGAGYAPGFQSARARATLAFVFEPSIGDLDGDGIKDDEDDCPEQPEDKDGFEDTRADSPPGQYGCPDPDNDGDGILDNDDECPNNPEDKDGDEDKDGCPETRDGDRDGDGIPDSRDKCPDEKEDMDGFEDKDGCPDPDNDKDGIPDVEDSCRDDPEDMDGVEDTDGCPEPDKPKKGVIIEGNDIIILEKVQFATGSAKILPASNEILDLVATALKDHPEFTMIEVQGHADERGADAGNLALTKARARSVMEALGQRKVPSNRIRSQGYGEYCPLDPASNAEAWEKNRRVEFKIVRMNSEPTGVELGCPAAEAKGVKALPP